MDWWAFAGGFLVGGGAAVAALVVGAMAIGAVVGRQRITPVPFRPNPRPDPFRGPDDYGMRPDGPLGKPPNPFGPAKKTMWD